MCLCSGDCWVLQTNVPYLYTACNTSVCVRLFLLILRSKQSEGSGHPSASHEVQEALTLSVSSFCKKKLSILIQCRFVPISTLKQCTVSVYSNGSHLCACDSPCLICEASSLKEFVILLPAKRFKRHLYCSFLVSATKSFVFDMTPCRAHQQVLNALKVATQRICIQHRCLQQVDWIGLAWRVPGYRKTWGKGFHNLSHLLVRRKRGVSPYNVDSFAKDSRHTAQCCKVHCPSMQSVGRTSS